MGRKKDQKEKRKFFGDLKEETKHGVLAISFFILVAFFTLASLGYAGAAGRLAYRALYQVCGAGFFLFPLVSLLLGISFLKSVRPNFIWHRLIGGLGFFFASLGLISLFFSNAAGGLIGNWLEKPLVAIFDWSASLIILLGIMIISLLVMFDTHLAFNLNFLTRWWPKKRELVPAAPILPSTSVAAEPIAPPAKEPRPPTISVSNSESEENNFLATLNHPRSAEDEKFTPPPLTILEKDSGKPGAGDIKANANIIKRTLGNFGIMVEMDEVAIGPSITRYALKPAEGVKLSRIVALQNDLSLALAAHPIRIEAPIPGKSLVGVEIPNNTKTLVGLASLMNAKEFSESPHPLLVSLGRGISGAAHFSNLTKAPHILIAGATGSGKSVVIHTFITSLLYRNSPTALKLIMIDPKRVELTLYNKIPHLLTPVITNPKRAIMVLKWLTGEMERRYELLEKHGVRDIGSYHLNVADDEKMPYIVVIIDELADIMSTYPRELEAVIVRLAQMSRAVGIHLVLSTQRPSVEVITGLIKANVPSRIALQVASQIDSRTIIDMAGAEKLLGAGDMLYLSGDMSKPLRLQSAFISETEVKKVVKFLTEEYPDKAGNDELALITDDDKLNGALGGNHTGDDFEDADGDDLYEEARETVLRDGKASASYLQRKLKVGYARAARLLDMLEERGVIGKGAGAKAREVYQGTDSEQTF